MECVEQRLRQRGEKNVRFLAAIFKKKKKDLKMENNNNWRFGLMMKKGQR